MATRRNSNYFLINRKIIKSVLEKSVSGEPRKQTRAYLKAQIIAAVKISMHPC
jgi:hypothetical protein